MLFDQLVRFLTWIHSIVNTPSSADTHELIHGQLLDLLETQYAAPLNKTIRPSGDGDDLRGELPEFPSTGAVQRILRYLVWNLGSHSESVVSTTQRALRIMCTLIRGRSWVILPQNFITRRNSRSAKLEVPSDTTIAEDSVSSNLDSNVAFVLNKNFLYILTNSIQKNWTSKSAGAQMHSLRLLGLLLKLLRSDDLGKFLPKVLVNRVIWSDYVDILK